MRYQKDELKVRLRMLENELIMDNGEYPFAFDYDIGIGIGYLIDEPYVVMVMVAKADGRTGMSFQIAHCGPEDEFSSHIGYELCLERAIQDIAEQIVDRKAASGSVSLALSALCESMMTEVVYGGQ